MNKEAIQVIYDFVDPLTGLSGEALAVDLNFSDNSLTLQTGFPIKPLESSLLPLLKKAYPDYQIHFDFFVKAHQTQLAGKGLRGIKNTLAIASGKGGVGKSTVSVNLALALSRAGAKVGLLDADIYGPSIPLMLGKHQKIEIVEARYQPISAHGIKAMSIGYLTEEDEALIWRGPMLAKTLLHLIDFTDWGELDYLIIDLPPGTGDIQLSLVQKIPLTGALVVTTPQTVATIDAQKAIRLFEKTGITTIGLIENMASHQCSACGHQDAIFGQGGALRLSDMTGIPLIGEIPLDEQIQKQCDEGNPTATHDSLLSTTYLKIAMKTAIALAGKPLNYANKFPPIVVE